MEKVDKKTKNLKQVLFAVAFLVLLFHDVAVMHQNKLLTMELEACQEHTQHSPSL